MNCQAQVEDFHNGKRYNLARTVVEYPYKACSRRAVAKVGPLCLCTQHVKLALDGCISEQGEVIDRNALRDVRRYPEKFPRGVHGWVQGKKPEPLPMRVPPSKTPESPPQKSRRVAAAESRTEAAILHLNEARDVLDAACRDLCSVIGANPFYSRIVKLSNACRDLRYELNEVLAETAPHTDKTWALDREPYEGEIDNPHRFGCGLVECLGCSHVVMLGVKPERKRVA